MDSPSLIGRLQHNGDAIMALVAGASDEQMRWKPSPDDWSILEVLNHLIDEEREDFRQRLDFTLHRPGEPWPPIDPPNWVIERRYNERDPDESRIAFQAERAYSLGWLRGLIAPDWRLNYSHPIAGLITAGDLLVSWVAHDTLHIRQLAGLHHAYLAVVAPDADIRYAGEW